MYGHFGRYRDLQDLSTRYSLNFTGSVVMLKTNQDLYDVGSMVRNAQIFGAGMDTISLFSVCFLLMVRNDRGFGQKMQLWPCLAYRSCRHPLPRPQFLHPDQEGPTGCFAARCFSHSKCQIRVWGPLFPFRRLLREKPDHSGHSSCQHLKQPSQCYFVKLYLMRGNIRRELANSAPFEGFFKFTLERL